MLCFFSFFWILLVGSSTTVGTVHAKDHANSPVHVYKNATSSTSKSQEDDMMFSKCSSTSATLSSDFWLEVPKSMTDNPFAFLRKSYLNDNLDSDSYINSFTLARKIGTELRYPQTMFMNDTATSWNSLVTLITSMNKNELRAASLTLHSDAKENLDNYLAWEAFRDAVVEAGTSPAYGEIKEWIIQDLIRGEEAAQIVAALPNKIRYPKKQLLDDFFKFSFTKKVRHQKFLNSVTILASTEMINRACINRKTAHIVLQEGSHNFLDKEVIPYLEKKLTSTIRQGDSHRAQVYIKAIGNLGHPSIFKVFAPYLEGKRDVSVYLRTQMVLNYERVAKQYPTKSRYKLYNIYQRRDDNFEVRVAAVYQLMKAEPTAAMLQSMASSTNTDPSNHVRRAIQSSINHAASLVQIKYEKLAKNARSVQFLLSDKYYGSQRSSSYFGDFNLDKDAGFFYDLSYIGSEDHIVPKSISLKYQVKNGHQNKIETSVSRVGEIYNYFKNCFIKHHQQMGGLEETIGERLEIKGTKKRAIEASIMVEFFNQKRFFAFNQEDVQGLPENIQKYSETIQKGIHFNYTKIMNRDHVDIMFPLLTGVPFFYNFKNPVTIRTDGRLSGGLKYSSDMPSGLNGSIDISAVYSSEYDGRLGFFSPLSKTIYTAGVQQKYQLYIPASLKADVDVEKMNIRFDFGFLNSTQDVEVLSYKQQAYTAVRHINCYSIPFEEERIKYVGEIHPDFGFYATYGSSTTGMVFEVIGGFESQVFHEVRNPWSEMLRKVLPRPLSGLSKLIYPFSGHTLDHSYLIVKYNAQLSSTAKVLFKYSQFKDKKPTNEIEAEIEENTGPWKNSFETVEILSFVRSRMNDMRVQQASRLTAQGIPKGETFTNGIDLEFHSADNFNGSYFQLVFSKTSSLVDRRIQSLFYIYSTDIGRQTLFISGASIVNAPNTPEFNFKEAIDFNTFIDIDGYLIYSFNSQLNSILNGQIHMEQSKEYKQSINSSKEAMLCHEQISAGNFFMSACQNVIVKSYLLNNYTMNLVYTNVRENFKSFFRNFYGPMYNLLGSYINEMQINLKPDGRMSASVVLKPDFSSLNTSLRTPYFEAKLVEYPVWSHLTNQIAIHPTVSSYKRWKQDISGGQYYPYCAVDLTQVKTFSSLEYPYNLDSCWHVVLQNGSSEAEPNNRETSILMRRLPGGAEIIVNYLHSNGEEIKVGLNGTSLRISGKSYEITKDILVEHWGYQEEVRLLRSYKLPSEELIVELGERNIVIVFDGHRLYLEASVSYRDACRGICGSMSGNVQDLVTPRNCELSRPELVAATWLFDEGHCDGPSKFFYLEAINETCFSDERQIIGRRNIDWN